MTKRKVVKQVPRLTADEIDGISSFTAVVDLRKMYLTMPQRRLKRYQSAGDIPTLSIQDMIRPDRVIAFTPSPPREESPSPPPDTEFAWLKLPEPEDDEEEEEVAE